MERVLGIGDLGLGLLLAVAILLVMVFKWVRILREYERGVVFRLGRVLPQPKGPGLVIILWPIDRLVPYARNARTHSEAQIDQIAASIKGWGWTTPVLVTDEGTIIAGHGRVRAARKLRLTEVPVIVASGWSKAQIQAYALADNKLALNAGWDEALLSIEIAELQSAGFEVDLIGFDPGELAALIPTLPTGSVFFHFIEARRRPPVLVDDFSAWLESWGPEYEGVRRGLAEIDTYLWTLRELRDHIARCFADGRPGKPA